MNPFKRKPKQTYYYLVTWRMKDNKPGLVVISLREARDKVRAQQIAQEKLHGRLYFIHETDTPDKYKAASEAKAKYFFNTGDLETSADRAVHPNIESVQE